MNHKKNSGFTLIEVLAAMVLLTLLITVFSISFIQSRQTVTNNGIRQTAMTIAQSQVKTVLNDGNTDFLSHYHLVNAPPAGAPTDSHYTYSCYQPNSEASITANHSQFWSYVFLQMDGSTGERTGEFTVQVYYGQSTGHSYVELYNMFNSTN
ncbi:MAG: type II secretion system protein [Sporolactobacillus sp.]